MFKSPKGAALVLLNEKNQILLLLRSAKSYWMPSKWGLPGGIVERGEHWVETAVRETREETNLVVENLRMLSINGKVVVYIAGDWSGEVKLSHEHEDWAWVQLSDLAHYDIIPDLKDLYELALKYGERKERN